MNNNYCIIRDCNELGEKAHLITRANLPIRFWDKSVFYIYLCRTHHQEQHKAGIETFCGKYNLSGLLQKAKEHLAILFL